MLKDLRSSITQLSNVRQAIVREDNLDEAVLRGPASHALKTVAPRANIQYSFPKLKDFKYLQSIVSPHLRELVDLSKYRNKYLF